MGGRRVARRATYALLVTTLALSTAAALAPAGALAAEASSIEASPSPIAAGKTLTVTGTVFGWTAKCEITIGTDQAPASTCFVAKDALTGTLTVPSTYKAGTYVITACSPQCLPPSTGGALIAAPALPQVATTTVDVEPTAAPPTQPIVVPPVPVPQPRLVAVPNVVGTTLADAVTALRRADLIPEYGPVPPNAHVSGQHPTAGTLVKVRSDVPLTLMVPVPKPAKRTNYLLIAVAGGVTIVVLIAVVAGARAFVRRRRRLARRWYYDHVRLASKPAFEVGFNDSGSLHLPSVQMAVRDTRLHTCELEEVAPR